MCEGKSITTYNPLFFFPSRVYFGIQEKIKNIYGPKIVDQNKKHMHNIIKM